MKIITRKEAKKQNLKHYFTGKACKNGHTAKRFIDSGVCSVCLRKSVDTYSRNNKDKISSRMKTWRDKNPNYFNDWYKENNNRHKQYTKNWKEHNPEKLALLVDKRRDKLKVATPKWYEKDLVKQVFLKRDELSSLLNIELTVDHIIPIQGDNVCGLHCWDNLQLLERSLNGGKKNLYEPNW